MSDGVGQPGNGRHVAVLGAGIVGCCVALELLRDGWQVSLIDPEPPGGTQAASHGNGGWLSPASVVPPSLPGLWRKLPRYLLDPAGPLTLRWSHVPAAMPWLVRYLLSGWTEARATRLAHALRALVADCPERHAALAAEAGAGALIRQSGLLYVYPSRAAFAAEPMGWKLRRACGITWEELDEPALRAFEPALGPRYRFGVYVAHGAYCLDPGAYVAALAARAEALGARILRTRARGFDVQSGRLRAVATSSGPVAADRAVIAAGVWSRPLARAVGDRVPLESERGYAVVISNPGFELRHTLMPMDGKMAQSMAPGGLRVAGQVEIAGLSAPPDWSRANILRDFAYRLYPNLPPNLPADRVRPWMGHRPSLPDSLPCIGPASASADVLHCFGHAHIGLAAGPLTGRLAADILAGRPPVIDPAPYNPRRF